MPSDPIRTAIDTAANALQTAVLLAATIEADQRALRQAIDRAAQALAALTRGAPKMPQRCLDADADDALEAWLNAIGHAWVGNGTYREPEPQASAPPPDRRDAATNSPVRAPLDRRAVRRGHPLKGSA